MNDSTHQSDEQARGKDLSTLPQYPIMAKRSLMVRAVEGVVPTKSRFLGFTWILALGAVLALFSGIQGEATQFYGIAESQLQTVSFQHPVEVVEIPVVEGEQVSFDTRLLEVRRYDLDVNLHAIDEQINEIRARQTATRNVASAEIASLKAELGARLQSLSTEIDSLESSHRLNQALLNSISSETAAADSKPGPIRVKIDGLKTEKRRARQLFQARIDQQRQKLADLSGPGDARVAELEKNRDELRRQSQALVVRAPFSGSVGSVLFKRGEQVAAFAPVMSVQGSHPGSIKGYIHEAVSNHVRIGQTVWVKSLNAIGDNQLVTGRVESLGSRIVEYPERLKRNPLVSAWGREAMISIAPLNDILQGEKVAILLERPETVVNRLAGILDEYLPITQVHAWAREVPLLPQAKPADIEIQIELPKPRHLEASGLVWYPPGDVFLLVSDEHSSIFELTHNGKLDARIDLDADNKAIDLESISRDAEYLYLATSSSQNRKGELHPGRSKLLRLQLRQHAIASIESIDLYQLLQALAENPDTERRLRGYLRAGLDAGDIDIESHAVTGNRLYLGFKSPLDIDESSIIVQLDDVNGLFQGHPANASIWHSFNLGGSENGKLQRLSDFVIADSGIYLLSVAADKDHPISYLSHFNPANDELTRIAEYPGVRAEGIGIEAGESVATIVFDGGGKSPSQWLRRQL